MRIRGLTTVATGLWLAMGLLAGCITINELAPPTDKDRDSGAARDSGPNDGAMRDAPGDGSSCTPAAEICNGVDDDCDGVEDDDDPEAQAYCEGVVVNSVTYCGDVAMKWVCVPFDCNDGFDNCDGNPGNGCEPYCSCNDCPDAGSDDGGADDAGAQ